MIKFRKIKYRIFCYFGIILVLTNFYYFYPIEVSFNNTSIVFLNRPENNYPSVKIKSNILNKPITNCTKWIVVTTISLPTDDVKYLHDSSFDWCVVVVADKKRQTIGFIKISFF